MPFLKCQLRLSQAVLDDVELRRQDVLGEVRRRRDEKKKVLEEQLQIIQQERTKVDQDVKVGIFSSSPTCRGSPSPNDAAQNLEQGAKNCHQLGAILIT